MSKKHSNLTPALVDTFKIANELALAIPYKHLPHRDMILDLITLAHYLTKYPSLQGKDSQSSTRPTPTQSTPTLPDMSEDFGPYTIVQLQALIHAIDPHHPAGMTITVTPAPDSDSNSDSSPSSSPSPSPLEPLFTSMPESVLYKDIASNYGQGVHTVTKAARELLDDPSPTAIPTATPKIMGSDGKDHIW